MTTTTTHLQSVLESIDKQLLSPTTTEVVVRLTRDEAAALMATQSEDHTLRVWTSGYGAGHASAMASTLNAISTLDQDNLTQVMRTAQDRCCHIWQDPALRQEALVSALAAVDAPACSCGAPLPQQGATK